MKTSKRASRLRLIALVKKHPEFSKSIGLEVSSGPASPTDSKTHSFRESSAVAAVDIRKSHD